MLRLQIIAEAISRRLHDVEAFDVRLLLSRIAAAAGDNSVTVWDVMSGRELQRFSGTQGTMMAAIGIYFLAFTPDNRLVTVSDAIRLWDVSTGRELRTVSMDLQAMAGFNGADGSITLSPCLDTFGRQREQNLSTVRRMGVAFDQALALQFSERGAHGLWLHSLCPRQICCRRRTGFFQP